MNRVSDILELKMFFNYRMAKRNCKRRTHRKGSRRASRTRRNMRGGQNVQIPPPAQMGGQNVQIPPPAQMGGQNVQIPPPAQMGGQAPVDDVSMNVASKLQLAQGNEYGSQHRDQHGGEAPFDGSSDFTGVLPHAMQTQARVPVMNGGVAEFGNAQQFSGALDPSLASSARIDPINQANHAIIGMKDGGARRRRGRKNTKNGKNCKSKNRKSRRGMRGGSAPVDSPSVLLPVDMERQAVLGMNPEWKLAGSPDLRS